MEELKSNALAFIAQNFTAVAKSSHDVAGLADTLLTRLAKVRPVLYATSAHFEADAISTWLSTSIQMTSYPKVSTCAS